MLEYLSISNKSPAFPEYLNFEFLRTVGIEHLQALSGQLWTDYNLHDPGVTILEVLCYAITELGYRTNLDMTDLLAPNLADPTQQETNFFTPDQVLTCNPVTELDLRKRLIDIPGVRNAWLKPVKAYEPAIYVDERQSRLQFTPPPQKTSETALRLHPRGLYTVYLDLNPESRNDACGQRYRSWSDILDQVKAVLCQHRNLCEDLDDILILGEEEIGLCTDIELAASADPEDVLVEIYVRVQEFLAPQIRFYTLQELLAQGKSTAEIFAGRPSSLAHANTPGASIPYASHGFIDTAELEALTLPKALYTSDLYQIIMDVPGVTAIRKLSLINYINGLAQSQGHPWYLPLTESYRPVLGLEQSTVTSFKAGLPLNANRDEVKRRYYEQQAAYIKSPRDRQELDLPIPQGSYADLSEHYSIHHDFPLTYGISEDGLADTEPALRQAQANQLKAYLIFFDQLLANYFAQLARIRDLFSWQQDGSSTYFSKALTNVPGVESILRNYHRCPGSDLPNDPMDDPTLVDYPVWLQAISEDATTALDRRHRFLDHLLARFAETFTDYVLINYSITGDRRKTDADLLNEKAAFLSDYPVLSRDRFRAFNYCDCEEIWDTANVSGFQQRVCRLLGIDNVRRRSLNHYTVVYDPGKFVFALRGRGNEPPLQSQRTYATSAEAQAALEFFLSSALDRAHYQRLSYRHYYHYGWDVTDAQGEPIVTFDRVFPSQAERNASLQPLLTDLTSLPEVPEPPSSVQLESDAAGNVRFRLVILVSETTTHSFTGIRVYPNQSDAQAAAAVALEQIQQNQAYQKARIRQDDSAERDAGTAEVYRYYGYGVMGDEGNLLATQGDRVLDPAQRDEALQRWLARLHANQNDVTVEAATECFFFELKDRTGEHILLRMLRGVPTAEAATAQGAIVLERGRDRSVYDLTTDGDRFGWRLQQEGTALAAHPATYATEVERNLRLDALRYYLNRPTPQAAIDGETGTFRATLLDRDGNPLLITYHSYSTLAQAEAVYQRLLYLASDPVYFQIDNLVEGDNPYSFTLVDRRGQTFATHPQNYPTSCQRDLVIRTIINYVNLEIERRLVQREDGVYYELIDQTDAPLLVGAIAYADEATANAAFESLLPLARDRANYQLIDDPDRHCPYSFALVDRTTLLATHPDDYDTVEERDQALQALINAVISDDPIYRIEGNEGQFRYALLDVLADATEAPYLLVSVVSDPDPDTAQVAFTQMLLHAAERSRYRLLDDLPAPLPYGFELLDDTGELLAVHHDRTNQAIAYATTAEREAAIQKIITYAARPEIQTAIVNEEGAFFAELQDEQGDRIWIGQRTFPSQETAAAAADLIRNLAQQPERYHPTQGVGRCPYSFELRDATDTLIATHPQVYGSTTTRDRKMQRLQVMFRGREAAVRISAQELPDHNKQMHPVFVGEIPAELFCQFYDCSAEQQQAFQSGSLLTAVFPQATYPTLDAARTEFLRRLSMAGDRANLVQTYRNNTAQNSTDQDEDQCYFTIKLVDPTTQETLADSPQRYRQRVEMEAVIEVIHRIGQGFTIAHTTPGTCCGYYFSIQLLGGEGELAQLRSLQRYPNRERAWQAAGEVADHLRYLSRYVNPATDAAGRVYGLGITDGNGILRAATPVDRDPLQTFVALNSIDAFLRIDAQEGEALSYCARLVDWSDRTLLVSSTTDATEAEARQRFYQDVLSNTFEPAAIERTAINGNPPYGFRVRSPPVTPDAEPDVAAIHPQAYATEAAREAAIARLLLLVRTARLRVNLTQQAPAYGGQISAAAGQVLLYGTQRFATEAEAWKHGNTLLELAQSDQPYRRIDDDDGTCTYSWELTSEGKDQILGVPMQEYGSVTDREGAIATLRHLIDDEGFHVLEHILLRPRQKPDDPPPSTDAEPFPIPPADEFLPLSMPSAEGQAELACQDPYSFWVSIVLPYWTERFRDINFRRFVERTLRLEAPAHVGLKICWVNVQHMQEFETAYRHWLTELSLDACQGAACDLTGCLNRLLAILPQLRSVYPEATLHDCEDSGPDDNPIILNQTALGTAND